MCNEIGKRVQEQDVEGLVELAQSIPKINEAIDAVHKEMGSCSQIAKKLLPLLSNVNIAMEIVAGMVEGCRFDVDDYLEDFNEYLKCCLALLDRVLDNDTFAGSLRDWEEGDRSICFLAKTADEVLVDIAHSAKDLGMFAVADKLARRLRENKISCRPEYVTYLMWEMHREECVPGLTKAELPARYIGRAEAFERRHMWRLWRHLALCLFRAMGYVDRIVFRGVQMFLQNWPQVTVFFRTPSDREVVRARNMDWIHLKLKHRDYF